VIPRSSTRSRRLAHANVRARLFSRAGRRPARVSPLERSAAFWSTAKRIGTRRLVPICVSRGEDPPTRLRARTGPSADPPKKDLGGRPFLVPQDDARAPLSPDRRPPPTPRSQGSCSPQRRTNAAPSKRPAPGPSSFLVRSSPQPDCSNPRRIAPRYTPYCPVVAPPPPSTCPGCRDADLPDPGSPLRQPGGPPAEAMKKLK